MSSDLDEDDLAGIEEMTRERNWTGSDVYKTVHALVAEVRRLREGITTHHAAGIVPLPNTTDLMNSDLALWSLIGLVDTRQG